MDSFALLFVSSPGCETPLPIGGGFYPRTAKKARFYTRDVSIPRNQSNNQSITQQIHQ